MEEPVHALPTCLEAYDSVRIIPFDPFADLAGMAKKRTAMLAQLSEERSKPMPNELLVEAYEIWLRVYNRNVVIRTA